MALREANMMVNSVLTKLTNNNDVIREDRHLHGYENHGHIKFKAAAQLFLVNYDALITIMLSDRRVR